MRRSPRILLYSHDTYGLGHIQRTLAIARHLAAERPDLSILILTGSSVVHRLTLPPTVDYVKLPCLTKVADESYASKYLDLSFRRIRALRERLILETIIRYRPDLILVDKAPVGVKGELRLSLDYVRHSLPRTRVILGLRDILDDPALVRAHWAEKGIYRVLEDCYDAIWVYGMPQVFEVVREYALGGAVAAKVIYLGYIRRGGSAPNGDGAGAPLTVPSRPFVVVTAGGGGDGYFLARTFLEAMALQGAMPPPAGVVVAGPDMPVALREGLVASAQASPRQQVLEFLEDLPALLRGADGVVSMGGYNTICEILSAGVRALVVPRVAPRIEQLLRAQRLAELGHLRMLHPRDMEPGRLRAEVEALLGVEEAPRPLCPLDLEALPRITALMAQLLGPGRGIRAGTGNHRDVHTITDIRVSPQDLSPVL